MSIRTCPMLLLALSLWACQPAVAPVSEPPPQRQDILNINERPERESPYTVEWGGLQIPLVKYANPEVYSGSIEIEISAFRNMVGQELRLLKYESEQEVEVVSIHREPYSRFSSFWFSYPGFQGRRLETSVATTLQQGLQPGDVLAVRLFSKTDSTIVQSVLIKVADPFEEYHPEVPVPRPRYDGDVFGFQLIQESGRRPLLRIDTAEESTRHIYDLYRHNRRYKIVHVPGFKTRRRLLTGRDQLFEASEAHRSELLSTGYDWLALPEYTAFEGADVSLEWGELLASPASENYHLADFRSNIKEELKLRIGNADLSIRGFHLFIHNWRRHPELYVADSLQSPVLLKALYKIQPASTVYFDKIVVEDEHGKRWLIPVAFAFNIGAELPFSFNLEESSTEAVAPVVQVRGQKGGAFIRFQNYPLSKVLPLLLGLDSTQLHQQNWRQDPQLDIVFSSAYYSLEDGKAWTLRELKRRFGIELKWTSVPEVYHLVVKDSVALSTIMAEPDKDFIQYVDGANKTALLVHITPAHLARFLTQELNVPVANHTCLPTDAKLKVEMDFSSLASARESLSQLGLALERGKEGASVEVWLRDR